MKIRSTAIAAALTLTSGLAALTVIDSPVSAHPAAGAVVSAAPVAVSSPIATPAPVKPHPSALCLKVRKWSGKGCSAAQTRAYWADQKRRATRASRSRSTHTTSATVTKHTQPVTSGGVWDRLAQCEAGGNWAINTGNGFYGGLQFTLSSWRAVGGSGRPDLASRSEQIQRGEALKAQQGWGAWPACSRKLGLR